jgi:hypothetical protein
MTWQRKSEWFARTFKPVKVSCKHPPDRIVLQMHYGERRSVCMKCGATIASQRLP